MTTAEFSDNFDVLINSYNVEGVDVNLTEHEKSWFLTEAQEQLVLAYYSGKNAYGESFEQTEEVRRYLANLIKTAELTATSTTTTTSDSSSGTVLPITANSKIFTLPTNLWFITYEAIKLSASSEDPCITANKIVEVVPVTQDEFHRIIDNPFRGPNYKRALRLDLTSTKVEIVSTYYGNISKYIVRYIEKLAPIELGNLDGHTIDGGGSSGCTLHSALHKPILELAVKLALQSRTMKQNQK